MQGPLVHLLLWAAARERLLAPAMWAVLMGSVGPGTAHVGGQQLLQAWGYKAQGSLNASATFMASAQGGMLHHQAQGVVAAAWDHALDMVWS